MPHMASSTNTQAFLIIMTEKFSSEAPGNNGKKQTRIILINWFFKKKACKFIKWEKFISPGTKC